MKIALQDPIDQGKGKEVNRKDKGVNIGKI